MQSKFSSLQDRGRARERAVEDSLGFSTSGDVSKRNLLDAGNRDTMDFENFNDYEQDNLNNRPI